MSDACRELNTTYCGVLAQQFWATYLLWETILNLHPEVGQIVEIGTGAGGFSLFLAHQAAERDLLFFTIDRTDPALPGLGDAFLLGDAFDGETGRWIDETLARGPAILHCDGGDKPREAARYGPSLLPGSLAIIHDYGHEFFDTDVPACLEYVHQDLALELGGISRVLNRKEA